MIVNQLNGQQIKTETVPTILNKSSSPSSSSSPSNPAAQMSSNTTSSSSSSLSSSPSVKPDQTANMQHTAGITAPNVALINDPNNAAYFQTYANFKVDLNNNNNITTHSQQQQAQANLHVMQQHQLAQIAAGQLNTASAQPTQAQQNAANQANTAAAYATLINNGAYTLNGLINNSAQQAADQNANLIASINAANFANFVNFSNGGEQNAAMALAVQQQQQQQQQQQKQTVNQQMIAGTQAQNQHLFNCIINQQGAGAGVQAAAQLQTQAVAQANAAINLNDEHQLYEYMHQLLEEKEKLKELFNEPFNILLPISAKLLDEG